MYVVMSLDIIFSMLTHICACVMCLVTTFSRPCLASADVQACVDNSVRLL